jgi:plastocyanin
MKTDRAIIASGRRLVRGATAATFLLALSGALAAETALPDCCARARAALSSAPASAAAAGTAEVHLMGGQYHPASVAIRPGDTVNWNWISTVDSFGCSVTSRAVPPLFDSKRQKAGFNFSHTFTAAGRYEYFCVQSPTGEHAGVVEVVGAQPLNISTRLPVQTGENVLIGGFIFSGIVPKKVVVRALGPSLQKAGVADAIADPVIEVRNGSGTLLASNDNWKDAQAAEIQATGVAPENEAEAAVVTTLAPFNTYTAIVSGKNGGTGVGLVEVYDLEATADNRLVNISTRGLVQSGTNVMIGGFILGNFDHVARVVVRALGPSLANAGIAGALSDPTLNLVNGNGDSVAFNNNWRDIQQAEIQATTIAPSSDLEAAVVADLPPGSYTAVVAGNGAATGVALVELYHLY